MNIMHFGYSLFSGIGQWVIADGYVLMFIGMLIEGPAITSAGAFAAKLGYFDIWIVFLLSILGNLIPDVIYYALGYWGRQAFIGRWGHIVGLTEERLIRIEELLKTHAGKTLFAIKMIPTVATPGLIAAGIARMNLKTYIWWSIIITIPSSLLFLIIGYYFGATYQTILTEVKYSGYLIVGFLALFLFFSYLYRKASGKFARRIGNI